jgi:hypothetical protein
MKKTTTITNINLHRNVLHRTIIKLNNSRLCQLEIATFMLNKITLKKMISKNVIN